MALDEHRNSFSPTLWYLPKFRNVTSEHIKAQKEVFEKKGQEWEGILQEAIKLKDSGKASDEDVNSAARRLNATARALNEECRKLVKLEDDNRHEEHPRTLKQVWFPGYHVNAGGGSDDTLRNEGDMEEMSSLTFAWMLDQIKPFLSLDEEYIVKVRTDMEVHISTLPESPPQSESLATRAKSIAAAFKKPSAAVAKMSEKLRSYGWGTSALEDSFTAFFYLNGSKTRTPGSYDLNDEEGQPIGDTFEYVHPVVGFRKQELPSYTPLGHGVKYERRKTVDDQGRPCVVYNLGDCRKVLPEWRLGGLDSYERLLIAGKAAYDYVDELDLYLETGIKTPRRSVWGILDVDLGIELPQTDPHSSGKKETKVMGPEDVPPTDLERKRLEWSAEELNEEERVGDEALRK